MVEFVDFSWIDQRNDDADLVIIDSRPPVKYLQGHIPRARNLPSSKLFDRGTLELLPVDGLASVIGNAGIDENRTVVVYDDPDGQNEAMLAWTLEFLGHSKVRLLSPFMERWIEENRTLSYRAAMPEPRAFHARPNSDVRATIAEISSAPRVKLVDLRSREEFEGKSSAGPDSRHLPGAVSLPWTDMLGEDQLLRPVEQLETLVSLLGLGRDEQIVTYCSFGPRAAIGYIALHQLGFRHVKVYDRSFQQWTKPQGILPMDNCLAAT